jgi:DNA-binding winged helix-turn-helix (wHTH) protein
VKHFHSFRLDIINECLWHGDERILLTRKAFAIACYLVDHAGRLVTKEELMEAVWPDSYVQEENLKGYILELRRALGDQPANPSFIETQRGRGYRFIAPVTEDAPAATAPAAPAAPRLLSGRDAEMARLQGWYAQAERGERQVVFITGEAGIGKTVLAEAFLSRAALRVLTGQCIESYREQEAYYPVLEAIGRLCRGEDGPRTVETLARLAPTWLAQFPALLTPERRESLQRELLGATQARMLREFCEALEAISAESPLALLLEDLHWADPSTLDLIAALAHRREPARLLLLATYRPVAAALSRHPLRQVKQDLLARRLGHELPLELLKPDAVTEYLAARFAGKTIPSGLAGLLHEQTDGRPLFLVAAVDDLKARGLLGVEGAAVTLKATLGELRAAVPESLYQFIEGQIAQLSEEEREALAAASVAGTEFPAWVVAAATGRELPAVEDCCEGLVARQLMLRGAGLQDLPDGSTCGRYQFVHSLYRETFYRRLSPVARLRLHQRLGEAMESLWNGAAEIAPELAGHFQEGRDWARAVRYLRLTASNDASRYAWREAAANLEAAFELAAKLPENIRVQTRIELLERLANVHTTSGDKLQAIKTWEQLVELARQSGQREAEARALLDVSHELRWVELPRALELCERAERIGRDLGNDLLRVEAEAKLCFLRICLFGWRRDWADTLEQSINWLRGSGDVLCFVRNAALSLPAQAWAGDYQGVERLIAECLPLSERLGDAFSFIYLSGTRSWSLIDLGQFGRAISHHLALMATADRNGSAFEAAFSRTFFAGLHCEAFDYAGALALCQSALPVFRAAPTKITLQRFLVTTAIAEMGLGNDDQAQACLTELQELLYEGEVLPFAWYWKPQLHHCLGELWLARGDLAAARLEAERMRELSDRNPDRAWQARARRLSARVAIAERDFARAESDIAEALAIVAEIEAPLVAWRTHETAAELCELTGRREQAAHHRRMRRETLLALAHSLDETESLRQPLLKAAQEATLRRL